MQSPGKTVSFVKLFNNYEAHISCYQNSYSGMSRRGWQHQLHCSLLIGPGFTWCYYASSRARDSWQWVICYQMTCKNGCCRETQDLTSLWVTAILPRKYHKDTIIWGAPAWHSIKRMDCELRKRVEKRKIKTLAKNRMQLDRKTNLMLYSTVEWLCLKQFETIADGEDFEWFILVVPINLVSKHCIHTMTHGIYIINIYI